MATSQRARRAVTRRFGSLLACAALIVALAGCDNSKQTAQFSYKPPLLPLVITVGSDFSFSVSVEADWVTALGTFSLAAQQTWSVDDAEYLVSLRHGLDEQVTSYKIRSKDSLLLRISNGSTDIYFSNRRALVTVYGGETVTIEDGAPPAPPTTFAGDTGATGSPCDGAASGSSAGFTGADGQRFADVDHVRLLDTRATGVKVEPNGCVVVEVSEAVRRGQALSAVIANIATVEPEGDGSVAAFECSPQWPTLTSVSAHVGRVDSANAIVPLDGAYRFCIASTVRTHVVVDLVGAFAANGSGLVARPTLVPLLGSAISAGSFAGVDVTAGLDPGVRAVLAHVRVDAAGAGYLAPCDDPAIVVLNFEPGRTDRQVVLPVEGGRICVSSNVDATVGVASQIWWSSVSGDAMSVSFFGRFDTRESPDAAYNNGIRWSNPATEQVFLSSVTAVVDSPSGVQPTFSLCDDPSSATSTTELPAGVSTSLMGFVLRPGGDNCFADDDAFLNLVVDDAAYFERSS